MPRLRLLAAALPTPLLPALGDPVLPADCCLMLAYLPSRPAGLDDADLADADVNLDDDSWGLEEEKHD